MSEVVPGAVLPGQYPEHRPARWALPARPGQPACEVVPLAGAATPAVGSWAVLRVHARSGGATVRALPGATQKSPNTWRPACAPASRVSRYPRALHPDQQVSLSLRSLISLKGLATRSKAFIFPSGVRAMGLRFSNIPRNWPARYWVPRTSPYLQQRLTASCAERAVSFQSRSPIVIL